MELLIICFTRFYLMKTCNSCVHQIMMDIVFSINILNIYVRCIVVYLFAAATSFGKIGETDEVGLHYTKIWIMRLKMVFTSVPRNCGRIYSHISMTSSYSYNYICFELIDSWVNAFIIISRYNCNKLIANSLIQCFLIINMTNDHSFNNASNFKSI